MALVNFAYFDNFFLQRPLITFHLLVLAFSLAITMPDIPEKSYPSSREA